MDIGRARGTEAVGARAERVEREMTAARRLMREKGSEAAAALDQATERMLNEIAGELARGEERGRRDPGGVEGTPPAVAPEPV